jgi:hypothetical protein
MVETPGQSPLELLKVRSAASEHSGQKRMKSKDIHLAESIIEENEDLIELKWKEYFKL